MRGADRRVSQFTEEEVLIQQQEDTEPKVQHKSSQTNSSIVCCTTVNNIPMSKKSYRHHFVLTLNILGRYLMKYIFVLHKNIQI